MGKVEANKKQKKESLLNTAFSLFTSKGFQKTSISDIVENAGVAKGTFYLYFTDKYDLRNKLIAHKAGSLFLDANDSVKANHVEGFENQIIHIIEYIIQRLNEDKTLLNFISKQLSWGVFRNNLIQNRDDQNVYLVFTELFANSGYQFRDPEIMVYMLIELVSGAIYNPLLYEQPAPYEKIKPYLFKSVRSLLRQHIITDTEAGNGSEEKADTGTETGTRNQANADSSAGTDTGADTDPSCASQTHSAACYSAACGSAAIQADNSEAVQTSAE